MTTPKKAVFIGSIAEGFCIHQVFSDAQQALALVSARMAAGQMADAVDIQLPSSLGKKEPDHAEGNDFVVFGQGLGNGFTIYGPFPDDEIAGEFGERHRSDGEEWECFVFTPPLEDISEALKVVCEETATTPEDWESCDGPETGVGSEQWFVRKNGDRVYTCDDQGHIMFDLHAADDEIDAPSNPVN